MSRLATAVQAAWQRQALWLWLLWPLSLLYGLALRLRRGLYRLGILKSWRAPVPVLVIGNITVGGSGKTPLIQTLVQALRAQGLVVGVISRGYGGAGPFPLMVEADTAVACCGDEPRLIVDSTGVAMAVGPDRRAAIALLLERQPHTQLILSDDGLQHLALQRALEWVVVDAARGLGNRQLLPSGFLREPATRLGQGTVIWHGDARADLRMVLRVQALQPILSVSATASPMLNASGGLPPIAGTRVHAVAGIAHPQRFFDTVRQMGLVPVEHAFADHQDYVAADLDFAEPLPLVTTAKDAVKLRALGIDGWVVPVQAALSMACWRLLATQLQALNIDFDPNQVPEPLIWMDR